MCHGGILFSVLKYVDFSWSVCYTAQHMHKVTKGYMCMIGSVHVCSVK